MKNISHISKDAYLNSASTKVLVISQEAKKAKKEGKKVYDATIGMLLDKNGELIAPNFLKKIIKNNIVNASLTYPASDGGKEYNDNVQYWVFKENYNNILSNYHVSSLVTSGGTGALNIAIRNYVDKEQEILLPDIGWSNYSSIAMCNQRKFSYYEMFQNNNLNIKSIKECLENSIDKWGRATIIINDPAHNPSGYSIKENEWKELIRLFNDINKKGPLTLILDIAYFDFAKRSRLFFELISKTNINFLTLVCFSASKTFMMYGLRLGAIIAISKNEIDAKDLSLAAVSTARSTWSCTNHHAITSFNNILKDKNNLKLLEAYHKKQRLLLTKRLKSASIFFKPLLKSETLPYDEGFFLTYKVKDADKVALTLKKKNIFVLPLKNNYIRIAICSFNGK